jgi:tRNA-modifying protein YgfZ
MALVYLDRSERPKLRFTGPQRAWFLHQILTQEFEDIEPGQAREAAMLTAHGRMVGYLEVLATEDALLAHMEPELSPEFPEAIRRYVFATQVEIEDVTHDYALILVAGDDIAGLTGLPPDIAIQPTHGLGSPAAYLWTPKSHAAGAMTALADAGARRATEGEIESIRIRNGAPRWGKDMDTKTFPQEAGIDSYAVHFEKGCYVGQEAMAKIHFRGKVNRRLAILEGEGLSEGTDVTQEGAKVGTVTSSAPGLALAMVKYTVEPGTVVDVGDEQAKVVA